MTGMAMTRYALGLHALALLVAGLFIQAAVVQAADHTPDELTTVKQNLKDQKAIIVDVRELSEWQQGHLTDAKLLPLSQIRTNPSGEDVLKSLPKDRIIYLHCRSGGRCRVAADLLKASGRDLRALKPGYVDLKAAGFETETGD